MLGPLRLLLLVACTLTWGLTTGAAEDYSLTARAKRGDVRAMLELGKFLMERDGGSTEAEGVAWLGKAAEAGNVEAQWRMARYGYANGDPASADRWLARAREGKDPAGLATLGAEMLKKGSTLYSPSEGMDLLERTVATGSKEALLTALHYERDQAKRISTGKFLIIAAKSGNAEQQAYIGTLLTQGWLLERDYNQAIVYFKAAVRGGYRPACLSLASVYALASEPQHRIEAAAWLRLALESPPTDETAMAEAMRLKNKLTLTPEEAAQVDRRAKELITEYALAGSK